MDETNLTANHLGELLRQMRQRQGIDLRDLAAMTKISVRHLTALEEGDLEGMPGTFFVRGFIRSVCAELRQDPTECLEILDVLFPEDDEPERSVGTAAGPRNVTLPLTAAGLALLLLLGGGILLLSREDPRSKQPAAMDAGAAVTGGKAIGSGRVEQDAEEIPVPVDLNLLIRAIERTWMRIQTDESDSWETTMRPGDEIRLRATESINLLIGNAGGIIFDLNGRRFGPPGSHGQVISNYVLTRDNL